MPQRGGGGILVCLFDQSNLILTVSFYLSSEPNKLIFQPSLESSGMLGLPEFLHSACKFSAGTHLQLILVKSKQGLVQEYNPMIIVWVLIRTPLDLQSSTPSTTGLHQALFLNFHVPAQNGLPDS